jgi:hypothetical protein
MNYALLDGETLTFDFTPAGRDITSSFWGSRFDALLSQSDWGTWRLGPGNNVISAFVVPVGAPTVTATITWRKTYWSCD